MDKYCISIVVMCGLLSPFTIASPKVSAGVAIPLPYLFQQHPQAAPPPPPRPYDENVLNVQAQDMQQWYNDAVRIAQRFANAAYQYAIAAQWYTDAMRQHDAGAARRHADIARRYANVAADYAESVYRYERSMLEHSGNEQDYGRPAARRLARRLVQVIRLYLMLASFYAQLTPATESPSSNSSQNDSDDDG